MTMLLWSSCASPAVRARVEHGSRQKKTSQMWISKRGCAMSRKYGSRRKCLDHPSDSSEVSYTLLTVLLASQNHKVSKTLLYASKSVLCGLESVPKCPTHSQKSGRLFLGQVCYLPQPRRWLANAGWFPHPGMSGGRRWGGNFGAAVVVTKCSPSA